MSDLAERSQPLLFSELAAVSRALAATSSRLAKRDLLVDLLRRASAVDIEVTVVYLSGELMQRRTGVGWASLAAAPPPADRPSLTVAEVDDAFEAMSAMSGPGSAGRRQQAVSDLFGRATEPEQRLLRGLISGDIRQGALDAAVLDAVASAFDIPLPTVRRAAMLRGATGPVAKAALTGGAEAVEDFTLLVGQPVRPMLASSAPDVAAALGKAGTPVSMDTKLDGIRIQVHKHGDDVSAYTRSLDDITTRLPEVVATVRSLAPDRLILDGEVMTLDVSGRPRPFQDTASRTASQSTDETGQVAVPFFFDVLHVDGVDLLDEPLQRRLEVLDDVVPAANRVSRLTTSDPDEAQRFFSDAVAAGQEGVVVKSLAAPYEAGRRGAGWVKVKPRHTLDLVVLAVEWGSGRRQGWLSNIHMGARDPGGDGFVMLGKTFKGMTDAMLAWQTERFLELETSRSGHVVHVRPEQVVEIAFDGLQRSTRYPGGLALRFARVLRYRDDKRASEADTIDTVRLLASYTPDSSGTDDRS